MRNCIKRFFNNLKNTRRVATRYDKTADSFMACVQPASLKIWFCPGRSLLITWKHVIDQDELKFKELEHAGIEKGEQLF
jgi:hypothetical protein